MRKEKIVKRVLWSLLIRIILSTTLLSFFEKTGKRFSYSLSSSWIDLKFCSIHSNLELISCEWLHRRSSSPISSYFSLIGLSCSSSRLFISRTNIQLKFLLECRKISKKSHQVNFHDWIGRNIRSFFFKTTVHVNGRVYCPNSMTESL